jgi:hypothetical protein
MLRPRAPVPALPVKHRPGGVVQLLARLEPERGPAPVRVERSAAPAPHGAWAHPESDAVRSAGGQPHRACSACAHPMAWRYSVTTGCNNRLSDHACSVNPVTTCPRTSPFARHPTCSDHRFIRFPLRAPLRFPLIPPFPTIPSFPLLSMPPPVSAHVPLLYPSSTRSPSSSAPTRFTHLLYRSFRRALLGFSSSWSASSTQLSASSTTVCPPSSSSWTGVSP